MTHLSAARLSYIVMAFTGVAILPGCSVTEPFEHPYIWTAGGVNEVNLAVMAESPADLAHGRAPESSDGQAATASVDRLRADHRKPLDATPTSGLATSGVSGASAGQN